MKKLHAVAIGIGLPAVTLVIVLGILAGTPALAAPPARPPLAPGDCVVTSTLDSGPGSLRECMANLQAGATITFNTSVFPPTSPVTIALASALPDLITDNVTIDASNAGVILDGSGVGMTPATALLDDISLTVVGGGPTNLIVNGDFSAGLGHWRPWDEKPGATRSIITGDFRSPPNAYQWDSIGPVGEARIVYDTTDTSAPLEVDYLYEASTVWIPAPGGSTVELRLWHKYEDVIIAIYERFADARQNENTNDMHTGWADDWREEVLSDTLPDDAIGVEVGLSLDYPERRSSGLVLRGASGCTIRGLQIVNFPGHGILLDGGDQNNTIGGSREIGTGPTRQGNLLSGNRKSGLLMRGSDTTSNTVSGNLIGTDATGSRAFGNGSSNVVIEEGSSYNVVGGSGPGEGNLISGSADNGILIYDASNHNTVSGNSIGTNISGTAAIPNANRGVEITNSAAYNVIGGDAPGEGNLISGNTGNGVLIRDCGTISNTVSGNYIGTNASGTASIGVASDASMGVALGECAQYNVVGGDTPGERNLISGNGLDGVFLAGLDTMYNTVSGNYIGTNISGTDAIPNTFHGVQIRDGASYNTIGGDTPGERNLISGNTGSGINVEGSDTMSNTVSGNYIGTDVSGTAAISNSAGGVRISAGAQYNVIGGATPAERNLISGNNDSGVNLFDSGTMSNTVSGNTIGTDAGGSYALPNHGGVLVFNGASHTRIEDNLVSGNSATGILIGGAGATGNTISGNIIGANAAGTAAIGNAQSGVAIFGAAHDNTIGPGNVIAYNGDAGVWMGPYLGASPTNNIVTQNSIYSNTNAGINLTDGGNLELFPPILTDVTPHSAAGQAPPGSTVEIFSDAADEGRYYHGSAAANASGAFTFTQAGTFTGTHVTATAADADGNTSEFSAGYAPLVDVQVVAILQPKASGKQGEPVTPTVKVGNAGTTQAAGIGVTVSAGGSALGGATYAPSAQSVDLPPLGYATLTFPPLTPSAVGGYDFSASVSLAGDQNAGNNTRTQPVAVGSSVIDLWTRDNPADGGDIPTRDFWQSPDLWVRHTCDGGTQHQDPLAGQPNCVYMLVRNRGSAASDGADAARVYWHEPSLGIKCGDWATIGDKAIASTPAYSGTRLLTFTWTPTRTGHTCLHGEIVSTDDPVVNACDIAWDNNLSQRNVDIIPGGSGMGTQAIGGIVFEVTNIKDKPKPVSLVVDVSSVPSADGAAVRLDLGSDLAARWASVDGLGQSSGVAWTGGSLVTITNHTSGTIAGIPMAAGETQTVTLLVNAPSVETTTVTIYEAIDAGPGVALADAIVGGNTYIFNTETSDVYLPVIFKKR